MHYPQKTLVHIQPSIDTQKAGSFASIYPFSIDHLQRPRKPPEEGLGGDLGGVCVLASSRDLGNARGQKR